MRSPLLTMTGIGLALISPFSPKMGDFVRSCFPGCDVVCVGTGRTRRTLIDDCAGSRPFGGFSTDVRLVMGGQLGLVSAFASAWCIHRDKDASSS